MSIKTLAIVPIITWYLTSDTVSDTVNKESATIFKEFHVGFGGSGAFPFTGTSRDVVWVSSTDLLLDDAIETNSYYADIKAFDANQFDALQQKLKNSKFVVYWITKNWNESWLSLGGIQKVIDHGYIPVFNYWYFGDDLVSGFPTASEIQTYYTHNERVANFIKQLKGTKIIIMEPEFNKAVITENSTNQSTFITVMSHTIDYLRANIATTLFSLSMMDTGNRSSDATYALCGYSNCALGDISQWSKTHSIYTALLSKLDFLSFSQIVGQFSRDPQNPGAYDTPIPKAYSDSELGIDILPERINNFTQYLHDTYHKPVFIPYMTIATATWTDVNSDGVIDAEEVLKDGWEGKAENVYTQLMNNKTKLQENGLFGFAVMGLFDDPHHDYGGYQYFMNNEYHLGIIKSSAIDEIDTYSHGDIVFKQNIIDTLFVP